MRTLLWWGRFDPGYSRNRILRRQIDSLGWRVHDFHPAISRFGDIQAMLKGAAGIDAVWVPCFRQRDLAAAARWAKMHKVPLIFDPLISAYDKQVHERGRLRPESARASRLLDWERRLFTLPDRVVADTPAHADYFHQVLGVPRDRISVIMVGADEVLFRPCCPTRNKRLEVLFFGSFIPLQGPHVIVEAARLYDSKDVRWTLLGDGPLRVDCEHLAGNMDSVQFESWLPYEQLPARICRADILLGIFGDTPKAGRVIPNKVYQALASARPLVTREAPAYPKGLLSEIGNGISWVPPSDAMALASAVAKLVAERESLSEKGAAARRVSERWFSVGSIRESLGRLLQEMVA